VGAAVRGRPLRMTAQDGHAASGRTD